MFSNAMFEFPLYEATRTGQDSVVLDLLKQDVNPSNYKDAHGNTALHIAVMENKPRLVAILLEHGADFLLENTAKKTPITLATNSNHWECVLEFGKYNEKHPSSELAKELGDPVLTAVRMGEAGEGYVRELLKGKVELNIWRFPGNQDYALHCAASQNSVHITQLLVEKGADTTIKNKAGETPALVAAKKGNWDCVNILMRYRKPIGPADVLDDSLGFSTILVRTLKATPICEDHVAILLKGKTAVNGALDPETKQTALHIAAVNSSPHVVLALIKAGADMTALDVNDDSAVTLAAKSKNWANVKVLAQFKNKTCAKSINHFAPALLLAVQDQQTDVVEDLLKAGAPPNSPEAAVSVTNNTPLHEAACLKNAHLLGLLLRFNANVHLKNIAGETAVDITTKLHDWGNIQTYRSPQYFSRVQAREILFILLISGKRQESCFYTMLPEEMRELILHYAFGTFTSPSNFKKYLINTQNAPLLYSIKALQQHIAVQSKKKHGFFSLNSIKFPPEIEALSQQLHSVCEEISSSQTKVDACNELIADFIAKYQREPSWSSAGMDLLIRFHLIDDSYKPILTGYIRQVNVFRLAIAKAPRESLPIVDEEPIVNTLCQQLKIIYDFREESDPSTVAEQMKERINAFVDRYGYVKEAMTLLAQFELVPKQSIFESLTFRSL